MALEIERKYLVESGGYKEMATRSLQIRQGYLCRDPERTVRVRTAGERGFLTVKGITRGAVREEYEYEVPRADALGMLRLCEPPVIEKCRWFVEWAGRTWEVDEYGGALRGLTVAEVELGSDSDAVEKPPFAGREVTGDPRYYNSALAAPGAPGAMQPPGTGAG